MSEAQEGGPTMARNPILEMTSAGWGKTPPCPEAKFASGAVVKVRRLKALAAFPPEAVVLCTVPPGFPAAWALADCLNERRPIMTDRPRRGVCYILVVEGDRTPYLAREAHLLPSGKDPVEIGEVRREVKP